MARISSFNIIIFSILVFLYSTIHSTCSEEDDQHNFVVKTIDGREEISKLMIREEKLSYFRFFWHDSQSGRNPSSIKVVQSPGKLPNGFGAVNMIDNPLTVGPEPSSKIVGRSQGFYASASLQEELALFMTMNFVFLQGKYNGSCITVLGRNPVPEKVREMPVIGGSRFFRFARGYAQAKTYTFNQTSGDAIVEYNIHVVHY